MPSRAEQSDEAGRDSGPPLLPTELDKTIIGGTSTGVQTPVVLAFANYLKAELVGLSPRDMIDVQYFMWCITPGKL